MKMDGSDLDNATTVASAGEGESVCGVVAAPSDVPTCYTEVQLSMKEQMYTDAFMEIKRV